MENPQVELKTLFTNANKQLYDVEAKINDIYYNKKTEMTESVP